MNVFVLDHQGLGNVITSLPLLERLVARFGPRGVHVVARRASFDLVLAAGVRVLEEWTGPLSAVRAARRAKRLGVRRLIAVPPILPTKARAFALVSGLRLVEPARAVPLHGAHPIGDALQAIGETLALGPLPEPSLPPGWDAAPMPPDVAADAVRWAAADVRLALHLGCDPENDHKRWAVASFAATLDRVLAQHPRARVALLGTETALTAELARTVAPRVATALIDFTARTTLLATGQILRSADALLSADSGLMHLAAAVDVPVFAVFGPTSAACWFPRAARGRAFQALACTGPCYPRVPAHCRRARCVDRVSPSEVASALLAHLAARDAELPEVIAA